MSEYTRVSSAAMTAGIDSLSKASRDLQSVLEDLKSQLRAHLQDWSGNAREEYQIIQDRWDKRAIEMNNVVTEMGKVLGQISQGYDDNETRVAGRWGGGGHTLA